LDKTIVELFMKIRSLQTLILAGIIFILNACNSSSADQIDLDIITNETLPEDRQ